MNKTFDRTDKILILLISIYLVVLFIFILWFILDKIEKRQIAKKGSSMLSSKKTNEKLKALKANEENKVAQSIPPKEEPIKPIVKEESKPKTVTPQPKKKTDNKPNNQQGQKKNNQPKKQVNNKQNNQPKKNPNNKSNTTKKNNSGNRNNGYVSPTKRKSKSKRKK